MRPEHADLIAVAAFFAEAFAEGDWEAALQEANLAYEVSHGAFLVAYDQRPGECRAITREYRNCPFPARAGEPYCGLHTRYIEAHKADA